MERTRLENCENKKRPRFADQPNGLDNEETRLLKEQLWMMNQKYVELSNENAMLRQEINQLKQELNLKHQNSPFFQYAVN